MTALAPTLEAFFTDRLIAQRLVSHHTVLAYRDTFRLLLGFVHDRIGKAPHVLDIGDLDAAMIRAFLDHLERDRRNSTRTRNARLAAVHSLFRFAALRHPEHAAVIAHVLAIPPKRCQRTDATYLTPAEVEALLAAPDRARWEGRRDHVLLAMAVQTGLRVSELTALTNHDVQLGPAAHVRCLGKGRKQRCTPLTRQVTEMLRGWLPERPGQPTDPLFPTRRGTAMSADAVALLVAKHAATAARNCPTLADKTVSPHVLRHRTRPRNGTAAMRLLHAGVDTSTIALWLGHERPRQPTSTCTPTRRSRNAHWPEPPRSAPPPGATDPPTPCSRSSSSSADRPDYAE